MNTPKVNYSEVLSRIASKPGQWIEVWDELSSGTARGRARTLATFHGVEVRTRGTSDINPVRRSSSVEARWVGSDRIATLLENPAVLDAVRVLQDVGVMNGKDFDDLIRRQ